MTFTDMVTDAVIVTLVKALTVICLVAMVAIVGGAFWKGRGMESVWPEEAQEPLTTDVPQSSDVRNIDASGGRGLQFRSVGAATREENAASAIDLST